jgi:two-component system, NtrC family, nitrogen regulation response regulator GlnG
VTTRLTKHILVVDDDPLLLDLVRKWLTDAGHRVATCDRFETAKRQLADSVPDVLLTDVRLGAFNGLQLVILARERGRGTVALVMSGFDHSALRKEALQCGASYLPKPFTREQVLAALQAATIA